MGPLQLEAEIADLRKQLFELAKEVGSLATSNRNNQGRIRKLEAAAEEKAATDSDGDEGGGEGGGEDD